MEIQRDDSVMNERGIEESSPPLSILYFPFLGGGGTNPPGCVAWKCLNIKNYGDDEVRQFIILEQWNKNEGREIESVD